MGPPSAVVDARESGASEAEIADLQATADELKAQRDSLFRGETLRGLLLSSYAWSTIGRIAAIAAWVAFAGAAVMAALVAAGLVHLRRTTPDRRLRLSRRSREVIAGPTGPAITPVPSLLGDAGDARLALRRPSERPRTGLNSIEMSRGGTAVPDRRVVGVVDRGQAARPDQERVVTPQAIKGQHVGHLRRGASAWT